MEAHLESKASSARIQSGLDGPVLEDFAAMSQNLMGICREGRLEDINPAGQRLLAGPGGDPDAVVGQALWDFLAPEYQAVIDPGLRVLLDETEGLPVRVQRRDGSRSSLVLHVRESAGPDGAPILVVLGRDIETPVRIFRTMVEARRRLSSILDQSLALICLASGGHVVFMNRAGLELLEAGAGTTPLGLAVATLAAPDYQPLFDSGLDLLAREVGQVPVRLMTLTGRVLDAEVRVTRLGDHDDYMIEARDITARKRALERVREREARLSAILAHVGEGIFTVGRDGRIDAFNLAAERLFQVDAARVMGTAPDTVIPGFSAWASTLDAQGNLGRTGEHTGRRGDGSGFPVFVTVSALSQGGGPLLIVSVRDISQRRAMEQEEERAKADLRLAGALLDTTSEGVAVCNAEGTVVMVNPAFATLTGHCTEALVGAPGPAVLSCPPEQNEALGRAFSERRAWCAEVWHTRPDGARLALRLGLTPLAAEADAPGLALTLTDVTRLKEDEERLLHQATHDGLTGLVNRVLFRDRLQKAVAIAMRSGWIMALMIVDLDDFRLVNETRGHDAGDLVLLELARRLMACARDSDTVARLDGDEFALLLNDLGSLDDARHVVARVHETLSRPVLLGSGPLTVTASIGVALVPVHALEAPPLLGRAGRALEDAKAAGKNTWRFPKGDTDGPRAPTLGGLFDDSLDPEVFAGGDDPAASF
ncbi:diguanylate cyclase domain-containing protein [Pararhodospirillum photometricum]|uniref:FOG: PAS/PAC domain n=1 Tax=Pararhodospirillum photometricum DSM 122 TaxID=1150469 RepID=H6SJB4_PARPM|nr:diguanylate cyclase [Pararhodospirillum photometricum]CCG08079.1 FOG: PAS/PAC domain [Pararhodospirillum photometricum DSM 122]